MQNISGMQPKHRSVSVNCTKPVDYSPEITRASLGPTVWMFPIVYMQCKVKRTNGSETYVEMINNPTALAQSIKSRPKRENYNY